MKVIEKNNIYNLPNFVSSLRVILLPYFIYIFYKFVHSNHSLEYYKILIYIIIIAVITDFLDGFLARILDEETVLGIYLDPVCDKIVTTSALFCLCYFYDFSYLVLGFHIFRELVGVWFGTFLFYRRGRIQGSPNLFGKLGVNYITFLVAYYISLPIFPFLKLNHFILGLILVINIILGGMKYFWDYRKILFNKSSLM